jgi:hypothetical protein
VFTTHPTPKTRKIAGMKPQKAYIALSCRTPFAVRRGHDYHSSTA